MKRVPLKAMSDKRRRDLVLRKQVVREVHDRDRTCQFFHFLHDAMFQSAGTVDGYPTECAGPLDVHEIIPRSAWPGGWLVPSNCVLLCRHGHHRWVTDNPSAAHAIALHGFSYERPKENP